MDVWVVRGTSTGISVPVVLAADGAFLAEHLLLIGDFFKLDHICD